MNVCIYNIFNIHNKYIIYIIENNEVNFIDQKLIIISHFLKIHLFFHPYYTISYLRIGEFHIRIICMSKHRSNSLKIFL